MLLLEIPNYFIFPSFGDGSQRDIWNIVGSFVLWPMENYSILPVSWSLRYEVLFYALFGAGLIWSKRKVWKMLLAGWAVISLLNSLLPNLSLSFAFDFIFNPFNLEFLMGCAAAAAYLRWKKTKKALSVSAIALGTASILSLWLINYCAGSDLFAGFGPLAWGLPSALIVFGLSTLERSVEMSQRKTLIFLGNASFSIYLTHPLTLSFTNKALAHLGLFDSLGYLFGASLCVASSILVGSLFYVSIEKRLVSWSKNTITGILDRQKASC